MFSIGKKKVFETRVLYWESEELLTRSGEGRGNVEGSDDGRKCMKPAPGGDLRASNSSEHDQGRQVFRRTATDWIFEHVDNRKRKSNRMVGTQLHRLGYRRRRGRVKTPRLKVSIASVIPPRTRPFGQGREQGNKGEAVIVYMDESLVYQAHGSA